MGGDNIKIIIFARFCDCGQLMVFVRNNYSIGQHFAMCCLLLCLSVNTYADEDPEETKPVAENAAKPEKKAKKEQSPDDIPMLDRWAFKTNAVEWMLTIPNFEVEFDLFSSQYNRWTIGMEAKYNWNTYHKNTPSVVFNHFDIRPEFRYYFRQKPRTVPKRPKLSKDATAADSASFQKDLRQYLRDSAAAKRPIKPWRAYFLGGYADYATYTAKFSPRGIQGSAVGFGVTAGYALPLRSYNKGAVDIEFSVSAGFAVASKDVFSHNADGYYYVRHIAESRGWHVVPYPVISEIKVAFAWRHLSIKDKYLKDDPLKEEVARVEKDMRENFLNEIRIFNKNAEKDNKAAYEKDPQKMLDDYKAMIDAAHDNFITNVLPYCRVKDEVALQKLEKTAISVRDKHLKDFEKEWRKNNAAMLKEAAAAAQEETALKKEKKVRGAESESIAAASQEETAPKKEVKKKEKPELKEKKSADAPKAEKKKKGKTENTGQEQVIE